MVLAEHPTRTARGHEARGEPVGRRGWAIGLFGLGTLAGIGLTLIVFAHLVVDRAPNPTPGLVPAFLAGVGLLVAGVWGGWWIGAGWRWRLRTALVAIAVVGVLLALGVQVLRRAERFARLSRQYSGAAGRLEMTLVRANVTQAQVTPILLRVHANDRMGFRYFKAAARPWLPVPRFIPCDCQMCTTHPPVVPSLGPEGPR